MKSKSGGAHNHDASGVTSFGYTYDANKNKLTETIGGVMASYGFSVPTRQDDEDWPRILVMQG